MSNNTLPIRPAHSEAASREAQLDRIRNFCIDQADVFVLTNRNENPENNEKLPMNESRVQRMHTLLQAADLADRLAYQETLKKKGSR